MSPLLWAHSLAARLFALDINNLMTLLRVWDYSLLYGKSGVASLIAAGLIAAWDNKLPTSLEDAILVPKRFMQTLEPEQVASILQSANAIRKKCKGACQA